MSSRTSTSSGECPVRLPLGRCGERTPLRSLENEMLRPSTLSSRINSKSSLSADVKMTKGDIPLCDPEPHSWSSPSNKVIQTIAFSTDVMCTETACGLGDITFKSFVCPGGEVEIKDSLLCAEESIILPKDQAMKDTCEDTVISDSMIAQTYSELMEHPYQNPEMNDAALVDINAASLFENTSQASIHLDEKSDFCGSKDVTWKSFVCDGGEVEVLDVTKRQDETIPLPETQLGDHVQDHSVNTTDLSAFEQLHEAEHADHPYCSSEKGVAVVATFSETTKYLEEPADGLSDVTFKLMNCTGGEIQISDSTTLVDMTITLPADQTSAFSRSYSCDVDPSMSTCHQSVQNINEHLDHPYSNIESHRSTPNVNVAISQNPPPVSPGDVDEAEHDSLVLPNGQTKREKPVSLIISGSEVEESGGTQLSQEASPLLEDQATICLPLDYHSVSTSHTEDQIQGNYKEPNSHLENNEVVVDTDPPAISTSSLTNAFFTKLVDKSINFQMQENCKKDSASLSMPHRTESPDCSCLAPSAETPTPMEVHQEHVCQEQVRSGSNQSRKVKDSALGSSGNDAVLCNSADKPHAETFPDVLKMLSECPSISSALQLGLISPVVKRASLFLSGGKKDHAVDQFMSDYSPLEMEKSLLAPVDVNPTGLWAEHLESPMPGPLFNSTAVGCKSKPGSDAEVVEDVKHCVVPQSDVEKPPLDIPLIPDGPLQQQLRQMAEFLFLASGKIGPAPAYASLPPPAVTTVPVTTATSVESYSVGVGTTPLKVVDHSINTSGQFEKKRDFSVADSCTLTDPLLWNLPPGSLDCVPKQELEQRLKSSMIMVEALVQQLATARAHSCAAGPAPSDLREKLVQTDHTELSQATMHKELYLQALSRIGELELDGSSLQNLIQCMQDMKVTMTSLSCDTDAALSSMMKIGDVVRDDHHSLVSHYGQMKSLFEKTKQTHTAMVQKVKDVLHQRDDMRIQMEEAFTAKAAAFSAMDQLRSHCAMEISELERIAGSQQNLSAALDQTYPELVALNKAYTEILNSASDVLSVTVKEQSSLMKELFTVRGLLQKTTPMLLRLNEKAAAALKERDECMSARDQAVDEREQMEEEWNQTNLDFQSAREQIGDLSLQVTILTSEMGVLRQKLTEREEERGQLERQVTELSATVSSTLASYTFLEQALAAETTKLQQSWRDIHLAKERANELDTSLGQSEQRVRELNQALAQSEEQLSQLQTLSQSQHMEIQQLQDVCAQLSGVREMNEFLQMENELAREQMAESECMLRANLQGLRERNLECEDLKGELSQLQLENRSLQEELETTRSQASVTQLGLGEKLAQAGTEIALLHHTLRGLTNELNAALDDQKAEPQKDKESNAVHNVERRHPSSSFVDSVMVALTAEKEEDVNTETPPGPADMPEPQHETLFSETSAFTRIAAVTPKKHLNAVEVQPEEDEQSSLLKLVAGLDDTVTELISNLKLLRQRKDAQLEEQRNIICGLQVEHEAANNRHQAEVLELQHAHCRLNNLVERGNQALQQKSQDEKTIMKLMSDIQETQEILIKHKTESNELRKQVVELRRSFQQSKVESQFLRGELSRTAGQSAPPAHFMEEKIQLLKEVERLKLCLQEEEQARVKLLERAKRHQIIHQSNQQKSENELQLLNSMINKVRETLLSLPDVVKNSEQLQQLVEYIG